MWLKSSLSSRGELNGTMVMGLVRGITSYCEDLQGVSPEREAASLNYSNSTSEIN